MNAFAELGYREVEEIDATPGSMTTDAYRARLDARPVSVAHIRATAVGGAALAALYALLPKREPRAVRAVRTGTAKREFFQGDA